MATELKLPNLGDDINDVTINRWLVKEGATVKTGDVLLEVATDKVDTEIPATADGVLLKINFKDGELAPIAAVLGLIGSANELVAPKAEPAAATVTASVNAAPARKVAIPAPSAQAAVTESDVKASPVAQRVAADKGVDLGVLTGTGPGGRISKDDVLATADKAEAPTPAQSPAFDELADSASLEVRRLAAEHNLDLRKIASGRPLSALTRYDLLSVIEGKPVAATFAAPADFANGQSQQAVSVPEVRKVSNVATPKAETAAVASYAGDELVKHSRMRAAVAKTTVGSAFTAPHVTTMWDVEMTAVLAHRSAHKAEFARSGVNLTVTAYLVDAILAGLKAVPAANATWTDEGVLIRHHYNIGMAVALPMDQYGMGGLIVPVIKNAGDLNLLGLARTVNELAEKARKNQLTTGDLAEGTFTLSNYGTSGSRFQTPIIVQPQVGILGVGAIEKRAIVVSAGHPLEANAGDYLTFRAMTTLGFSYDHRVLDGATADAFCAAMKKRLENFQ